MISILLSVVLTTAPEKQDQPAASAGLFSRRAMRNARLLIEMRMLELREERLECLRRILLRRLPPELVTGEPEAAVKQSSAPHATSSRSEECTWVSKLPRRHRPMA